MGGEEGGRRKLTGKETERSEKERQSEKNEQRKRTSRGRGGHSSQERMRWKDTVAERVCNLSTSPLIILVITVITANG